MAKNYSNPPIKEALIEAWPALDNPPNLKTLSKIAEALPKRYSEEEKIINTNVHVKLGDKKDPQFETKVEEIGLRRKTASGKNLIQITKDFFTANWIGSYKSGDELLGQFSDIWDIYTKFIRVPKFKRIAVRFINEFEIPTEKIREDVLKTEEFIKISFDLEGPEKFTYFDMNQDVKFFSKKFQARGHVKVSIKPKTGNARVVFDITAYREGPTINNEGLVLSKFEDFKKHYEVLRKFKNEIFEENLTEKIKESFK